MSKPSKTVDNRRFRRKTKTGELVSRNKYSRSAFDILDGSGTTYGSILNMKLSYLCREVDTEEPMLCIQ